MTSRGAASVTLDTIRGRVLAHLQRAAATIPDETVESGEVFYYVGGRSWPTFVREINRMERDGLIRYEWSLADECFIGLPLDGAA